MSDDVKPYTPDELDRVNRGTLRIAIGEYGDDVAADGSLTDGNAHARLVEVCDRLLATARAGLETTSARSVFERTAADFLASAVCYLTDNSVLDARSAAGDALLDYASIRHGDSDPIGDVRREGARLWAERRAARSGRRTDSTEEV